jgi:hypothetical protein
MVTRSERLNDFIRDRDPAPGMWVELLCEDHVGTYVVPFPCRRTDDAWHNANTGEPIVANVVGWREGRRSVRQDVPPAD